MSQFSKLSQEQYWSNRYINKKNGWDMGQYHPFLPYIQSYLGNINQKKILVIGAGPGHDAQSLSLKGADVTALDFSEEAFKSFKKYYPESNVKYIMQDFFHLPADFEKFDIVLEHTLLCAIDPNRYQDYFSSLKQVLKPKGYYAAIIWNQTYVEIGPPFSVKNETVKEFLKPDFKIHVESPIDKTVEHRKDTETFILAVKQ